jgi:hypothetical protein
VKNDVIIRVRGLRKVYHTGHVDVEALRGVDLDVPRDTSASYFRNSISSRT